jgi:hypothetical protein
MTLSALAAGNVLKSLGLCCRKRLLLDLNQQPDLLNQWPNLNQHAEISLTFSLI